MGNLDLAGVSTTAGKRLWGSYAVNLAMAGSRIGLASCAPSESEADRRRWAANRPNRGEAAIFGPRQASTRTQVQRYGAAHFCHGFAGCCRFDLLTRLDFPPVQRQFRLGHEPSLAPASRSGFFFAAGNSAVSPKTAPVVRFTWWIRRYTGQVTSS